MDRELNKNTVSGRAWPGWSIRPGPVFLVLREAVKLLVFDGMPLGRNAQ